MPNFSMDGRILAKEIANSTCTVRWRPSGGRGEYEVVPSSALAGYRIIIQIPSLGISIPAEITGTISQGKPRLRKDEPNNRSKLHLVPLVMAAARLPDPAREDKIHKAVWPLENKGFLISHMEFEIVNRSDSNVVLKPLHAKILHSDEIIDFHQRFNNIVADMQSISEIRNSHKELADAISRHYEAVKAGINHKSIRSEADTVIGLQATTFGKSNTATVSTITKLPPTILEEDIEGREGKILTRLHSYRERDRTLVKKAKLLFKQKNGKLFCECCGFESGKFYGVRGKDRIQAHHRRPVEELLPDSQTNAEDLAMVCPNCHDIIHSKRPWISVEELREELVKRGSHYFK